MIKIGALIPHRSNVSGLFRALQSVSHLPHFIVLDGVEKPSKLSADIQTIYSPGLGFAGAVNIGMVELQLRGFTHVLLLNDDAWIDENSIEKMIAAIDEETGVIGPTIKQDGQSFYGFSISNYGRIKPLFRPLPCDALSGACMIIPSWVRFDSNYPHGIEDIDLCLRLTAMGLKSICVFDALCHHDGAQTLSRSDPKRQRASVYGQLRLFKGREKTVLFLNCLQILRERGGWGRYRAVLKAYGDHKKGRRPSIEP